MLIRRQIRLTLAVGGAVLAASATLGLLEAGDSSPAAVSARPDPPLLVSIDDQRTGTASGERLTYTIRVRNNGSSTYPAARISQRLPAALEALTTRPAATISRTEVSWTADVPAGGEVAVALTGLVGDSHNNYPRLVTTGCVAPDLATEPTMCGSDVNALNMPRRSPMGMWLFGGFVVLLGAIGVGLWRWLTHQPSSKPSRARTSAGTNSDWKPRRLLPVAAANRTVEPVDVLAGVFVPKAIRAAVERLPYRLAGHARSPPRMWRRCERPSSVGVAVVRIAALSWISSLKSTGSPVAGRRRCRYR